MHGRSIFESEFSNNVSSPRDKTKRKQKFTLKISERIAKFVARNTTMRIGIASRRVGSHYLASFRKKKRKGGGGGGSPEPRSIFLPAISSFTVDQPTVYARASSPDGSIRVGCERESQRDPIRLLLPSPCPFRAPYRGAEGGRLDGGALFTVSST